MNEDCGQMMSMVSGPMMLAMGSLWLLVLAVLVLTIAALVKYLRSGPRS